MYFVLIAAIILGSVALDQISKLLIVRFLEQGESIPLWEDVLHITYVKNPGAAFGMLSDNRWVFMTVSTVAIIAVLFYLIKFRPTDKLLVISLSMIVGGGIGNMIDRILLKYVIDFIDFRLINFAVFNVADSFVTVGAGILILYLILDTIRDYRKTKAAKANQNTEDACVQPDRRDSVSDHTENDHE